MTTMRRIQTRGILVAALLTLSLSFSRATAAENVSADRLLPPDVYLYVDIPSVPDLKARWSKTLTGQLGAEPALSEFWNDVEAQIDKFSEQAEQNVGVSVKDLIAVPTGQVALAVIRATSGEVGLVAILDYGENGATVDKLLAKANQQLQEHEAEKSEQDVDGTKVVVHHIKKSEQADGDNESKNENPDSRSVAYFTRDNRLVLTRGLEIAKTVLARWDGKHSSTFADNETHKYILNRCKTSNAAPALTWYVNPIEFARGVIEMTAPENQQAQQAMMLLPLLGLNALKAIGGTFDMAAGDFDSVARTVIYVEGESRGLLNILRFPETELSPPKWVSAAATNYVTYNWDVHGAYSAVEALVDGFQGPGALDGLINRFSEQPAGPKIHLKKDFLDHLTGRVHMVGGAPKEKTAEAVALPERILFAFDAKNADNMKTTLANIAGAPEFNGKSREFSGTTIYEFQGAQGITPPAAAAVIDNALMVATDVSMLEQVARADSDQQPLSESPEYRRIAAFFPAKASAIEFEKQDAQFEAIYEVLRSGNAPVPIPAINFSKLPPFSDIKKYLPATGSFAVPDEHGAYYESFTLPKTSAN
jgi:hypothetical protein